MSHSSSKQVSHMSSLYESIYAEVLTEEQQNELLMVELYNALVKEGFIKGDLVQDSILSEVNWGQIAGAVQKYGPKVGSALKQVTGLGTNPTTGGGRAVRGLQKLTTGAVAGETARRTGVLDRTGAALEAGGRAFVADPKKKFADSFDVFDAIKGHLLDEGYADTEDAALKIMANMSEEWRENIVEGLVGALAKGASVAARAVKNAPKTVDNAMKYYEKNPAAAAPFLAPAIAASGMNAKKQQSKGNVVK